MARIIPAQLSFLAIYNPTFATSEENLQDQILFYTSRATLKSDATSRSHAGPNEEDRGEEAQQKEQNERLRQIGLAQGMVVFAK